MKLRIAIVVIGLLAGLVARVAVEYYTHFRSQRAAAPPAAAVSPMLKTDQKPSR